MAIRVNDEAKAALLASIRRFSEEVLELEIGDLKAALFLDYCLREVAPSAYNQGVLDAQAYMHGRLEDLEGTCYEPELGYWNDRGA